MLTTACYLGVNSVLSFASLWVDSNITKLGYCGKGLLLFMRCFFVSQYFATTLLWILVIWPKTHIKRTDLTRLRMLPGYWILYSYVLIGVITPIVSVIMLISLFSDCRFRIKYWTTVSSISSVVLCTWSLFAILVSTLKLHKIDSIISQLASHLNKFKQDTRFAEIRRGFGTSTNKEELMDLYYEISLSAILPLVELLPFERHLAYINYQQRLHVRDLPLNCGFCEELLQLHGRFVCLPACKHVFHFSCFRSNTELQQRCPHRNCLSTSSMLALRRGMLSNNIELVNPEDLRADTQHPDCHTNEHDEARDERFD